MREEATGAAALPTSDCDWLYNQALGECVSLPGESCESPGEQLSLAVLRGTNYMNEKPGYNDDAFVQACMTACTKRQKPSREVFGRSVCGET